MLKIYSVAKSDKRATNKKTIINVPKCDPENKSRINPLNNANQKTLLNPNKTLQSIINTRIKLGTAPNRDKRGMIVNCKTEDKKKTKKLKRANIL